MIPLPNAARRSREVADLRVGFVVASLMVAIPGAARLATRLGWAQATEFSERALMVLLAGFIVLTGNIIPKHSALRWCDKSGGVRLQAFFRFAGWTWVLAGLGLGLAWLVLPLPAAGNATVILMPTAVLLMAGRGISLRFEGRRGRSRRPEPVKRSRDVIASNSSSVSMKPPAGYTEALYWRITDTAGRLVKINLLALPMAAASGLGFLWVAQSLGRAPRLDWRGEESVIFVVGTLVVLVLHESVHGILMRWYGAKPRFGFFARGGMFYAKAAGHVFTRQQYLVVVLGPLVTISVLAVLSIGAIPGTPMVWLVVLWAIVNASAACADVWIAALLLRYPATAYVVDEWNGLRILVPSVRTPSHSAADRPN
jgi:hypothetical protein